jgi:flagellar hook protein FlgE
MNAAETTIDVVGNNVANANTVGFKSSRAVFATQFLQTQSLGSGPTDTSGGRNPRQIGLGAKVAEITPNFTQGTIQISSTPTDLAIQGDGFFIVEGAQGEHQYTRNGILKTNAENELVNITGQRLLGQGVDNNFQIQNTTLQPITIPLGSAAVAQATRNVFFEGTLRPQGDLADTPEIIHSAVLSDGSKGRGGEADEESENKAAHDVLVGEGKVEGKVGEEKAKLRLEERWIEQSLARCQFRAEPPVVSTARKAADSPKPPAQVKIPVRG